MINKIIIVGGGSAGWMTAATLSKFCSEKEITLIESPNIPTVGVGDSTLGQINQWLSLMGIKDEDFMKHCNATYKLSIRFENFGGLGDGGFHYPFGPAYIKENKAQLNDWYFKKIIYPHTHNMDYAECIFPQMAFVGQNRLSDKPNIVDGDWTFQNDVAYHFDATLFAHWLKDSICIPNKVKHIQEEIETVEANYQDGVQSLNKKYKADLYIDCTGFKSLLLGKTLKEPFEKFDYLPNNSAWATKVPYRSVKNELKNYTNCTAMKNGWIWTIPLWDRIGTGYVYSDKYVSDNDALEEFKYWLGNPSLMFRPEPVFFNDETGKHNPKWPDQLEFKKIKFEGGIYKNAWVKNVCAIGLAAGFIEPLESNGLLTVHEYLHLLLRCLGRTQISQFTRDNFNFAARKLSKSFAEFVGLHYALSSRTDTKYWRDIQERTYPFDFNHSSLNSDFQLSAIDKMQNYHYSSSGGLHCIATGLDWPATDLPSLMKHFSKNTHADLKKEWTEPISELNKRKMKWFLAVRDCPTTLDFLQEKIYGKNKL